MDETEIQQKVVELLTPYVKDKAALERAEASTRILDDLQVDSARLVDLILAFEDEFDIEISDEEIDDVATVGDCAKLIHQKTG